MQMFPSVSCTCNPWSQPSKMLFVSSFICILSTVILWNMMPRGRISPFGSSGPELLNYWWNTDVISASGRKCTLLENIKIVSSIISFCFNLLHFHSCRCVCACFFKRTPAFMLWVWRHFWWCSAGLLCLCADESTWAQPLPALSVHTG